MSAFEQSSFFYFVLMFVLYVRTKESEEFGPPFKRFIEMSEAGF